MEKWDRTEVISFQISFMLIFPELLPKIVLSYMKVRHYLLCFSAALVLKHFESILFNHVLSLP